MREIIKKYVAIILLICVIGYIGYRGVRSIHSRYTSWYFNEERKVNVDSEKYYEKLEKEGFFLTSNSNIDREITNKKDIPVINIKGDLTGIGKDEKKEAELTFEEETYSFKCNIEIEWQGSSSLMYPKKNYSIDLISKEDNEELELQFRDWPKQGSFHLKANYIDVTHARNIVTANLIEEAYDKNLVDSVRGVIDGFPIKLYENDKFVGVYTWNLKQHRDLYGLDKDNANHLMYRSEYPFGAGAFKDSTNENIQKVWKNIYPKDDRTEHKELQRVIQWVQNASYKEFKNEINEYFDLDYLIDYYVIADIGAMRDNYNKNLNLVTYDGKVWYTTFYDLDSTWGINWQGKKVISPEYDYLKDEIQPRQSLLWEKVNRVFKKEIKERYTVLRTTVFTKENIINQFKQFEASIGSDLYEEDIKINDGIPSVNYDVDYISKWVDDRFEYLDNKYN